MLVGLCAYEERWQRNFEVYLEYKRVFGKEPSEETVYKDVNIGLWCSRQRKNFMNGTLSSKMYEQLQKAGFVFNQSNVTWEKYFKAYNDYRKEFGKEPSYGTVYNSLNLGLWCKKQRADFEKGTLTPERIERLRDAGFVFERHCKKWEMMFACARQYFKENGNLLVPRGYKTLSGENLDAWLAQQRKAHKNGRLPAKKCERLDSIGMIWDAQEAAWEFGFEAYIAFKKEFGREPRGGDVFWNVKVGAWRNAQLRLFAKGELAAEKVARLRAVGFAFELFGVTWEHNFKVFVVHMKLVGQMPAPGTVYNGTDIGRWCATQQKIFNKGTLSSEKVERLRNAGFDFDMGRPVNSVAWQRKLDLYVVYKTIFGEEPIQSTVYRGVRLGAWCANQRVSYKKGILSAERVEKLKDAGFVFYVRDAAWERKLEAYVAYKVEFGKEPLCRTVHGELQLGSWCFLQRQAYKANRLFDEKIQKLRDAGFPFTPQK